MTIRAWQQLSPSEAARELHRRLRSNLSPQQQQATIATELSEPALVAAFTAADRSLPLGGAPYFLKDLFDVAGQPTYAGSTFLPEVRPPAKSDSVIVQALRSAGAVLAGKSHLHEFAYGITGENPHYGDCEHPRFPGRTAGGSSSGSAALVAAGVVPLAIGTDTGGSIRVPAAFCGLHGFRLSPGDRLIAGAFPLSPRFDTAGWFTANAADMLLCLDALVGTEPGNRRLRGGYLELPGLDADVAVVCANAAQRFAQPADRSVREALLATFRDTLEVYTRIVAYEAWAVHASWADRCRPRYDPAVWRRLERGRGIDSQHYKEACVRADAARAGWQSFFREYDFLVMPATPFGALTKADCTLENRNRLLSLNTPASVGGLPVLTVPVTLPSGLTTGLQIVAPRADSPVFRWALGQR